MSQSCTQKFCPRCQHTHLHSVHARHWFWSALSALPCSQVLQADVQASTSSGSYLQRDLHACISLTPLIVLSSVVSHCFPCVHAQAEEVAGLHILELEGSHLTQLRAGAQPQIPADSFQQLISQSKAAEVCTHLSCHSGMPREHAFGV